MSHASLDSRVYEGADIIDSRDVIARIEELESERAEAEELIPDLDDAGRHVDIATDIEECHEVALRLIEWDSDDDTGGELARLQALAAEAEGYAADWHHGEALIADHYFEEYAQDLAEDIGAIDRNASWPLQHIDWKAAAEALQQDYTSVEYGGTTYWIR